MLKVTSIQEILQALDERYRGTYEKVVTVPLQEANGRYLARDVMSKDFLPAFDRSVVDGYAVKICDMIGASETMPAYLKVSGEVEMGEHTSLVLREGEAIYVPTGGMVPRGTDAMVMVEFSEKIDNNVLIKKCPIPKEHMMCQGDEVKKGQLLYRKGNRLSSRDLGVLAAMNVAEVLVYQTMKIGIIPTGNEIIQPGTYEKVPMGKIVDINSFAIKGQLEDMDCNVLIYPVILDDMKLLKEGVELGVKECDLLLISGGSSAGIKDYTKSVIEGVTDGKVFYHGMSMKPGKPTIIGDIGGASVIGLPGQPVSAFMVTHVLVKALLDLLRNHYDNQSEKVGKGCLTENVQGMPGRTTYQMVKRGENLRQVQPLHGKSGMITLLKEAIGYIIIEENCEGVMKGEEVTIYYI